MVAPMKLALELTADASELVGEVGRSQEAVGKLKSAVEASDDAQQRMAETMREAEKSVAGATGGLQGMADVHSRLDRVSQDWDRSLAGAAGTTGALGERTRLTTQQLQALGYTASDVAASLASGASPFTILLQQGGQLLQAFPGLIRMVAGIGGAAALGVAPLAILGSRVAEIGSQTRELATVIEAMGNVAGVSAEELRDYARAAVEAGASRAEAFEAALELARNPRIRGAGLYEDILQLSPDLAAILGSSVPTAAAELAKKVGEGTESLVKFAMELNALSDVEARAALHLGQFGDRASAAKIVIGSLKEQIGGAAIAMRGEWGSALREGALAWDTFVERIAKSDLVQLVARQFGGLAQGIRQGLEAGMPGSELDQLKSELLRIEEDYSALPEVTRGTSAQHEALIRRRIDLTMRFNELTKGVNDNIKETERGIYGINGAIDGFARIVSDVTPAFEYPADVSDTPEFVTAFEEAIQ